jgi:hypothetical protein
VFFLFAALLDDLCGGFELRADFLHHSGELFRCVPFHHMRIPPGRLRGDIPIPA